MKQCVNIRIRELANGWIISVEDEFHSDQPMPVDGRTGQEYVFVDIAQVLSFVEGVMKDGVSQQA